MKHKRIEPTALDLIRRAKEVLWNVGDLGMQLRRERYRTNKVAESTFGPRSSWVCAICNRSDTSKRKVEAAHIVPLEEGGTTEPRNLIPLCGGKHASTALAQTLEYFSEKQLPLAESFHDGLARSKTLRSDSLACHKLLDAGLISTSAVRKVLMDPGSFGQWKRLRDEALDTPLRDLAGEKSPTSARHRTITRLSREMAAAQIQGDIQAWFDKGCALISGARRTSSQRHVDTAINTIQELNNCLDSKTIDIRPEQKSRFFYEAGMVTMTRQPRPDLHLAIELFRSSLDCVKEESHSWAMTCAELVHAETFSQKKLNADEFTRLITLQERCLAVLAPGMPTNPTADDIRWTVNILIHRAQLKVKGGHIEEGMVDVRRVRELRETLTVASGWTQYQGVHLAVVEGACLAASMRGKGWAALGLLLRAAIAMSKARGKRPEGYKDLCECAVWALKSVSQQHEAVQLKEVARLMTDGRSGFWPPTDLKLGRRVSHDPSPP